MRISVPIQRINTSFKYRINTLTKKISASSRRVERPYGVLLCARVQTEVSHHCNQSFCGLN
jgi:ribosomal protein L34E